MLGAFVPNWLMGRHEVSAGAKLLYARLAQHAYKKDHCWPGQATLVEELGENLRQIQRYVAELRRCGLIETSDRGIGRSQVYSFLDHEWMSAYADKYGGSMPTNTADISESRSDPPVTDSSEEESSSSGAREDEDDLDHFLRTVEDLYTNLPSGLRSPLVKPAAYFKSVRENGSTIPRFRPTMVYQAAEIVAHAFRPLHIRSLQLPHPKEAAGLDDVQAIIRTHPKLIDDRTGNILYGHLRACVGHFLATDEDAEGGELNPDTVLTRLARQPDKLRRVIDLSG
jgi:hypothetical protein